MIFGSRLIESKLLSDDFSVQTVKSKINDINKPQKIKTKFQELSGTYGENVNWVLDTDTETGVLTLTIFGTENMDNYSFDESIPG